MSEGSIDIKIAVDGQENKDLYKTIDINIESHQEKVPAYSKYSSIN